MSARVLATIAFIPTGSVTSATASSSKSPLSIGRRKPLEQLLQILTNFRKQLAWAERFRHIVIAASRPRNPLFSVERIGGDCDNRDRSQRGIGFDPPRGGVTVHNRQLDIQLLLRVIFSRKLIDFGETPCLRH